ncbi:retrovirus-related Pol polyprotein from transposon 412 [Trichonephila clavipes]|nr:retrovirus-related Pol polyprotein from transposon 412 [Trichonephila clavipes]
MKNFEQVHNTDFEKRYIENIQFNIVSIEKERFPTFLNQNHRPIAFASRTLNKAERNYTVTERECLVVIWALNKFKTYFVSLPVKVLKLSEFNIEWEHRPGVQKVVANVLSKNPVGNMDGSQISCAALRALALNSREQLIREQREDPELGHIYRYLEISDDGSVNATICEDGFDEAIMKEFHDLPLAGHLEKRKTYLKLRDTCYLPNMRKYIFEYVSTCDRCQKFNYKSALPAGRLIPIVSNYPNEIVTLDLLGPYPASRPERYRFLLVITDHFTKWSELIPLRKASAQAIANALFENYISRYGSPISLISDNGPQFISEVFEHLSHRLDIKHMKTVTYRPQANLTERVNRNLVQMIACFVKENHENWDRFLHKFAFALRTSVNETTNKTPAELFLGRKIITPFSKLINVTEGAEYVGRNIEKLFDEARQNMRKHKHWGKYYNRKRREVSIKVNDLVVGEWLESLCLSLKGHIECWSSDSHVETLYEGQRSSDRSSRSEPGKFKGSRKTSSEQSNSHKSSKGNAGWEDPRLKRKVESNGSGDRKNFKRSKICRKRSLQGSEHRNQKRPTLEPKQGIKRAIPSSVSSRNYKYRRPNNPSPGRGSRVGSRSIAGPSHQQDSRQDKSSTVASRHEGSGQYNKARETKTTKNGTNRAAERRTDRSKQTTAVRPCPYYLRSRVRQPEGFSEERRNSGIASIPQNNIRRRSLRMEALDGDPVDRSE